MAVLKICVQTSQIDTYKKIWLYMHQHPETFVNTTKEGIERVETSDYAFLLESTMNEYVTHRDCSLKQIGGLIDYKGYGIGVQRGRAAAARLLEPPTDT